MPGLSSAPVAVVGELNYYSHTDPAGSCPPFPVLFLFFCSPFLPAGERPYTLMFPSPGPHLPFTNAVRDFRQIPIHDLRPLLDDPEATKEISTETTGFEVVPKKLSGTSMKYEDWEDEEKIKEVYLPEVEEMLKKHLGATRVIFFDHTVRRGEKEGEETPDTPSSRKPVPMDTFLFPFLFPFPLSFLPRSDILFFDDSTARRSDSSLGRKEGPPSRW
jgi:hypothetical protein